MRSSARTSILEMERLHAISFADRCHLALEIGWGEEREKGEGSEGDGAWVWGEERGVEGSEGRAAWGGVGGSVCMQRSHLDEVDTFLFHLRHEHVGHG